jgi:hypothetical protein
MRMLKPSRLVPIVSALLLLAAWILWAFASDHVSGRFIAGLWVAALVIALVPITLLLIALATSRKRSR